VGEGLARGAAAANLELVGGETAVMPEVVKGLDLAGTCAGLAEKGAVFPEAAEVGDALVGWPSSGIHSNGLTLAREAVTREYEYSDPYPHEGYETIGEALLEPTRLYTTLLTPMRTHGVRAAAHVTGGGWTNLERLGEFHYEIDNPCPADEVFAFVQELGGISDTEMHRTFNMGTGFVAALDPADAEALTEATDGRIIGEVREGDGVSVRGMEL
jgi:phosphoribosylformylglycinamidine cyclo-ligase